jgi:hypothetical protein
MRFVILLALLLAPAALLASTAPVEAAGARIDGNGAP